MGYSRLQWVTIGGNGLQSVTVGCNGVTITIGYNRSQVGYNGLQFVTVGYNRSQLDFQDF